jgi:hypothetical protein
VPRNTSNLPGLSVPPFNIASGVNQSDAMVLAQILACDLANGSKYAVLPRTDSVEAVLAEHKRQRDGTTDQERVRRLGAGRNARYVLSGSVQKLGTINKFATDILDIEDGNFLDGHEEQYTSFSQGFELVPKLAAQLNGFSVTVNSAATFTKAIADIKAAGSGMYTITLTASITSASINLEGSGYAPKTVIIQGDSTMRTVTSSDSTLFSIKPDSTLILGNNVTLNGNSNSNFGAVVTVFDGGRFEMRNGSVITGSNSYGVFISGTFTLAGGTIRNNKDSGVVVYEGTVTMSGGTISGNTASGGGGVRVGNGTFTMSGGAISGNTASGIGGGVYVDMGSGTFTMSGGTISGNTAGNGGGVYVYRGTFTKTGGTVTGYANDTANGNVARNSSRTVQSNQGHAVYVDSSPVKRRESTAGPNVNLDSTKDGAAGGWE